MSPLTLRRYRAERLLRAGVRGAARTGARDGARTPGRERRAPRPERSRGLLRPGLAGPVRGRPGGPGDRKPDRLARRSSPSAARSRSSAATPRGRPRRAAEPRARHGTRARRAAEGAEEPDFAAELDDRMQAPPAVRGAARRASARASARPRRSATCRDSRAREAAARMGISQARMRKLMDGRGAGAPGRRGQGGRAGRDDPRRRLVRGAGLADARAGLRHPRPRRRALPAGADPPQRVSGLPRLRGLAARPRRGAAAGAAALGRSGRRLSHAPAPPRHAERRRRVAHRAAPVPAPSRGRRGRGRRQAAGDRRDCRLLGSGRRAAARPGRQLAVGGRPARREARRGMPARAGRGSGLRGAHRRASPARARRSTGARRRAVARGSATAADGVLPPARLERRPGPLGGDVGQRGAPAPARLAGGADAARERAAREFGPERASAPVDRARAPSAAGRHGRCSARPPRPASLRRRVQRQVRRGATSAASSSAGRGPDGAGAGAPPAEREFGIELSAARPAPGRTALSRAGRPCVSRASASGLPRGRSRPVAMARSGSSRSPDDVHPVLVGQPQAQVRARAPLPARRRSSRC